MKKHLLFALSLGVAVPVVAQEQRVQKGQGEIPAHLWKKAEVRPNYRLGATDPLSQLVKEPNPTVSSGSPKTNTETIIGITTYDLQSNASVGRRLHVFADGSMSAVWTTSNTMDLAASDRGTGYNHRNASGSWLHAGNSNTTKIESSLRTGWPSIFNVGANGEGSISHGSTNELTFITSSPKGTGNFNSEVVLPGNLDSLLWPRAASSVTGDTIHLFGLTIPTANLGAVHAGLDGAMTYSRSTDGGVTWDIQKLVLPGMAASDGYFGFSGDGYAMDVKGDNVVLLIGDQWYDTFMMKSTDGGDNWTKHMIWQHPLTNYNYIADNQISDIDMDGTADTVLANDGSMWVSIDNSGNAHAFFGQLRGLNDATGDGNSSYFPFTDGLLYWNENMTANQFDTIGFVLDLDNNQVLDVADIGTYFTSLSSMPSAMIDNNGDMYVTYSSIVEYTDAALGQAFRNIYGIKSTDGGATWSAPVNLTPSDFDEAVFGSLGNRAPNFLHLVYQRDGLPGLAVRGDEHAFQTNDIVHVELNKSLNVSVNEVPAAEKVEVSIYPNPANESARMTFTTTKQDAATIRITNLMGAEVATFTNQAAAGYNAIDLDVSGLASGIYLVTLNTSGTSSTSRLVVQ